MTRTELETIESRCRELQQDVLTAGMAFHRARSAANEQGGAERLNEAREALRAARRAEADFIAGRKGAPFNPRGDLVEAH